jgi:hypothetical protein
MNHKTEKTEPSWFERNVNLLIVGLVVACASTLVAELIFRPFFDDHHPAHFEIENVFGFQAALGFVAFVVVVFLGRLLRLVIKRDEDYYDA